MGSRADRRDVGLALGLAIAVFLVWALYINDPRREIDLVSWATEVLDQLHQHLGG